MQGGQDLTDLGDDLEFKVKALRQLLKEPYSETIVVIADYLAHECHYEELRGEVCVVRHVWESRQVVEVVWRGLTFDVQLWHVRNIGRRVPWRWMPGRVVVVLARWWRRRGLGVRLCVCFADLFLALAVLFQSLKD